MDNQMFFINLFAWLFVLGVCLSIVISICIFVYFRSIMERERHDYRTEVEYLRHSYEEERKELMDRLMANSFSEYKSYQEETIANQAYRTPETNFIKKNIDAQNAMYDEERQAYNNE